MAGWEKSFPSLKHSAHNATQGHYIFHKLRLLQNPGLSHREDRSPFLGKQSNPTAGGATHLFCGASPLSQLTPPSW